MKTARFAAVRGIATVLVGASAVTCSSSIYDVRRANEHRSAKGITEAMGSFDSRVESGEPFVSHVSTDSDGPAAYLFLVNLIRAPFIPVVGTMEIAGAALAGGG